MPATHIARIRVKSAVGTLFLTGPGGEFDSGVPELWVKEEGSQTSNGGTREGTRYVITFGEAVSPQALTYKGRFAGA